MTIVASALAQAPMRVAFDAASVKRSQDGDSRGGVGLRPGGYAAANALLRTIILHAYRVKAVQLVGGPDWIDAERFDIQARAPRAASDDEMFAMVRTLLADRFKLAVHREERELPVYVLA